MPRPVCPSPPPLQRLPGHPEFFPSIQQTSVSSSRPLQPSAPSRTPPLPHRVNQRSSNPTIRAAVYISLYVDVNTFIGGRQPQNTLMRLRTFKIMLLGLLLAETGGYRGGACFSCFSIFIGFCTVVAAESLSSTIALPNSLSLPNFSPSFVAKSNGNSGGEGR